MGRDRMHPQDLRARMAGSITNGLLSHHSSFDVPSIVEMADLLLAELERTAPKEEPEHYNGLEYDLQGLSGNDASGWPVVVTLNSPSKDHEGVVDYVRLARAEAAETEVKQAQENHREVLGRLFKVEGLLADSISIIERRQIEKQEVRRQLAPLAKTVGILTPDAHSVGYLAKELLPPIMAQLSEAKAEVERITALQQESFRIAVDAQARLAAIDAGKAGEPPIPFPAVECPYPSETADAIFANTAWGRQGWDTVAVLQEENATLLRTLENDHNTMERTEQRLRAELASKEAPRA